MPACKAVHSRDSRYDCDTRRLRLLLRLLTERERSRGGGGRARARSSGSKGKSETEGASLTSIATAAREPMLATLNREVIRGLQVHMYMYKDSIAGQSDHSSPHWMQ